MGCFHPLLPVAEAAAVASRQDVLRRWLLQGEEGEGRRHPCLVVAGVGVGYQYQVAWVLPPAPAAFQSWELGEAACQPWRATCRSQAGQEVGQQVGPLSQGHRKRRGPGQPVAAVAVPQMNRQAVRLREGVGVAGHWDDRK